MKKYLSLIMVVLAAGFMSCQKSYTCECTTTIKFQGSEPHLSKSSKPIGISTTEKQATGICKATEASLNDNLQKQLSDPNVQSTSSAACALK